MNRKVLLLLIITWLVVTFLSSGYTGAMDETVKMGLPFYFYIRYGKTREHHIDRGFQPAHFILDIIIVFAFISLAYLLIAFLSNSRSKKIKPN